MNRAFQRGRVIAVSVSHLLHDTYQAFLAPLIPLLVEKFGVSLSTAGMLDAVRNAPTLFNPFLGLAVDRIATKYFIIITPAVSAVIMSLVGIAPSYGTVVVMIFVAGVNAALFHVPGPVLIKRLSGGRTGSGMSFYMLGGELSRSLGPLVITGAISLWGLPGTWRLMPVGLAASIALFFVLRDYQGEPAESGTVERKKTGSVLRSLVPLFGTLAGFLAFMHPMKMALTLYLPAYLVAQGRTLMSASLSLSILQFAGAAGTLLAGSISDRIGRRATLVVSGIASPVLMWLLLITGDAFAIPILIALGFVLFAPGPVILALVQDVGHHAPAFANGVYMPLNFAVRSLMVYLVGRLVESIGFDLTYRIAATWAAGVVVLALLLPRLSATPSGDTSHNAGSGEGSGAGTDGD
jgi:FSR family fosmidomycin resistance protein-like MFS transporter